MPVERPFAHQTLTYPAVNIRRFIEDIFTEGILTGFAVSQRGAGVNMSVDVSVGRATITGDDTANQGVYHLHTLIIENVIVTAAPGVNSRIDRLVLRANDPSAGGGVGNNGTLEVIAGVVAAAPVAPAQPNTAITLATISVAAGTISINNAQITDGRTFATLTRNVVSGASIVANSIGVNQIGAAAVTTAKILDGAVTTAKILDGNVTAAKIAANTITSAQIGTAAVGTDELANGSITNDKMALNSIFAGAIADGNVTTAKIANLAVDSSKITATTSGSSVSYQYRRSVDGMVHVWTTAVTSGGLILPVGFRPVVSVTFAMARAGGASCNVTIDAAGALTTSDAAGSIAFSITFQGA